LNLFISFIVSISIISAQAVPYIEPLSKEYNIKPSQFTHLELLKNKELDLDCHAINNLNVCQIGILLNNNNIAISLDFSFTNKIENEEKIYILDEITNDYIGPLNIKNSNFITSNPIKSNKIIIEINSIKEINNSIIIHTQNPATLKLNTSSKNYYKRNNSREEPIILLTGYWPPTNEMIRHFSQNDSLNPIGWQGNNWENRGYDIVSYFPEFSNPECSSCGQGYGDIEVDYQDTTEDFWPITGVNSPLGIITFSRGFMDQSWELEYNAYNRTNWYNDFTSPFLPTPNPPDSIEENYYLRNSNLPMEEIVSAISNLNIGLNPYIDINGDPGHYVSEYMAYHGTWYRDLHQFGDNNCIAAGHIHVGGYINWDTAILAAEESIRVLIDYLDSFSYTPGDLNQDSIIDILDLVTVINFILGSEILTNIQEYAADINEDSIINIQDVIMIINIILN